MVASHYYSDAGSNQNITNALQTNGTLLDNEWLDILDGGGFSVGLSIDGPPELHNRNRIFQKGEGSFEKIIQAVSLMKSRKISFGALSVVTESTIKLGPEKYFNFFVENNLKNLSIICQRPALISGKEKYITRNSHSQFVNEVFDLWYELNDPDFHIRDFESIIRNLLGSEHSMCLLGGGCIGKYLAINVNGDAYHCDEFMIDPKYKVGNIIADSLQDILSSEQMKLLIDNNDDEIHQLECKWFPICKGGCPKDRYVTRKMEGNKKIRCCGYADLIQHIQNRIS
jgi:uncharacterized protein